MKCLHLKSTQKMPGYTLERWKVGVFRVSAVPTSEDLKSIKNPLGGRADLPLVPFLKLPNPNAKCAPRRRRRMLRAGRLPTASQTQYLVLQACSTTWRCKLVRRLLQVRTVNFSSANQALSRFHYSLFYFYNDDFHYFIFSLFFIILFIILFTIFSIVFIIFKCHNYFSLFFFIIFLLFSLCYFVVFHYLLSSILIIFECYH